ncbi:hypothetical protein LC55x_3233 [Lysobacter capsici]|nr:hypothetical protein LC55x_3233 [Lysobacter capsici]
MIVHVSTPADTADARSLDRRPRAETRPAPARAPAFTPPKACAHRMHPCVRSADAGAQAREHRAQAFAPGRKAPRLAIADLDAPTARLAIPNARRNASRASLRARAQASDPCDGKPLRSIRKAQNLAADPQSLAAPAANLAPAAADAAPAVPTRNRRPSRAMNAVIRHMPAPQRPEPETFSANARPRRRTTAPPRPKRRHLRTTTAAPAATAEPATAARPAAPIPDCGRPDPPRSGTQTPRRGAAIARADGWRGRVRWRGRACGPRSATDPETPATQKTHSAATTH